MAANERDRAASARAIGRWGTAARLLVGGFILGSVIQGSFTGGTFRLESWLLGLVGFPAVPLSWQVWRARRHTGRLVAVTGPVVC